MKNFFNKINEMISQSQDHQDYKNSIIGGVVMGAAWVMGVGGFIAVAKGLLMLTVPVVATMAMGVIMLGAGGIALSFTKQIYRKGVQIKNDVCEERRFAKFAVGLGVFLLGVNLVSQGVGLVDKFNASVKPADVKQTGTYELDVPGLLYFSLPKYSIVKGQ